jgi:hypothetical protein
MVIGIVCAPGQKYKLSKVKKCWKHYTSNLIFKDYLLPSRRYPKKKSGISEGT